MWRGQLGFQAALGAALEALIASHGREAFLSGNHVWGDAVSPDLVSHESPSGRPPSRPAFPTHCPALAVTFSPIRNGFLLPPAESWVVQDSYLLSLLPFLTPQTGLR